MINKMMTADEAVAGVKDGMTIMVGGFLATGSPEILMDALVRKGVKHLTVIANDGGLDVGQYGARTARGVGKLLENHMVDHIIASHLGVTLNLTNSLLTVLLSTHLFLRELLLRKLELPTMVLVE